MMPKLFDEAPGGAKGGTMKLESITIRAPAKWEKQSGYIGEITFDGPLGKVLIRTGDALSRRILKECADEIVAASKQVAQELTASIIDARDTPALPEPPK